MEEELYSVNLDIYNETENEDSFCLSMKKGDFSSDIDDSDIYLNKASQSTSQLISSNENKDQSHLSTLSTSGSSKRTHRKKMPREEYKKLRQLKNKEAARRSRKKKKAEMELLKAENSKLRKENRLLKEKIDSMQCPNCNSKMIPKKEKVSTAGKYISQAASSIGSFVSSNKSQVLFTTFVVVLFIFANFLGNNAYYQNSKLKKKIRQLQDKNFVLSLDDLQQKDYSFEKMYITYGEYYSITHNKSVVVDKSKFYFEKKKPINFLSVNDAANFKNETCRNCLVELNHNNIVKDKVNPFKFKLILFSKKEIEELSIKAKTAETEETVFYEAECEASGVTVKGLTFDVNALTKTNC